MLAIRDTLIIPAMRPQRGPAWTETVPVHPARFLFIDPAYAIPDIRDNNPGIGRYQSDHLKPTRI